MPGQGLDWQRGLSRGTSLTFTEQESANPSLAERRARLKTLPSRVRGAGRAREVLPGWGWRAPGWFGAVPDLFVPGVVTPVLPPTELLGGAGQGVFINITS